MNTRTQYGEWKQYGGREPSTGEQPDLIYPVYVKNATLFIGNEMVLFNRPGFCWDGEQDNRKYTTCIEEVLSTFSVSDKLFDSVYVFKAVFHDQENTAFQRFYYSAPLKIMVQREVVRGDTVSEVEKLIGFEEN
jgi:solute carrier family 34 (sodium-dependent phosphate cotransporter)